MVASSVFGRSLFLVFFDLGSSLTSFLTGVDAGANVIDSYNSLSPSPPPSPSSAASVLVLGTGVPKRAPLKFSSPISSSLSLMEITFSSLGVGRFSSVSARLFLALKNGLLTSLREGNLLFPLVVVVVVAVLPNKSMNVNPAHQKLLERADAVSMVFT